jgi:integrase
MSRLKAIPIANLGGYWKNVVNRAMDKKKKEEEAAVDDKGGEEAKRKDEMEQKRIHFHQLRHTAAALTLETGELIGNVSAMLGHGSIAIAGDIYSHVISAGRKQTARALGKALFGKEE